MSRHSIKPLSISFPFLRHSNYVSLRFQEDISTPFHYVFNTFQLRFTTFPGHSLFGDAAYCMNYIDIKKRTKRKFDRLTFFFLDHFSFFFRREREGGGGDGLTARLIG